jgi:stage II sporulation protein AA (anti-sigma F factor antagonist)
MSPVEVQLIARAGIAVAAVSGEVDLDERDRFEEALRAVRDGQGPAVLDLGAVPFMDSSGLHVVVQLWQRLQREGRALVLASPAPGVRKLFELTALDRMLAIYDDADAAVDALRRGEPRVSAGAS